MIKALSICFVIITIFLKGIEGKSIEVAENQGHGQFDISVKVSTATIFHRPESCQIQLNPDIMYNSEPVKAAFQLIVKDAIKYFACLNEGAVSLLSLYCSFRYVSIDLM